MHPLHVDSALVALKLNLLFLNTYYYNFAASKLDFMFANTYNYNVRIIGVHRAIYWSPIQSSTMRFTFSIFLCYFGNPLKESVIHMLQQICSP